MAQTIIADILIAANGFYMWNRYNRAWFYPYALGSIVLIGLQISPWN